MQSTSLSAFASDTGPQIDRGVQHPAERIGKRLIGTDTVLAKVPWSRTTLWRRIKDGNFPPPIRLSDGLDAWLESSVDAWIDARMSGSGE